MATPGYRFDFATGHVTVLNECPRCTHMAELSDDMENGCTFTEPLCRDCRWAVSQPQPQSEAERRGDA